MKNSELNRPKLPTGYVYPDADEAADLQREFERELPPGHLLFGVPVEVFAMADGNDDTLFQHVNQPGRFTVVHLTGLGRTEINAGYPSVQFDGTFADFFVEEECRMSEIQRICNLESEDSGG